MTAVVTLTDARLAFGERVLWDQLDLAVRPGEFVAVLGPNGAGKTSLLRVLLGQMRLSAGTASVNGQPASAGGGSRIGYVPQHHRLDRGLGLRGRDLVRLGVDRHRWGFTSARRADRKRHHDTVDWALREVDAHHLADVAIERMSGGEFQRLRIAQAIAGDPLLLLCDEPLLNLDPANAGLASSLIDRRRRAANTAVLFVTHEINPVLPYVDWVLYLVGGRFRMGAVADVINSSTLSELYRADVEVVRIGQRYIVAGENFDHSAHLVGHE